MEIHFIFLALGGLLLIGMLADEVGRRTRLPRVLEQGYEVAVVRDAMAAAQVPEGDGYQAAIINFRFVANAVWWTDDAVERIAGAA